MQYAFLTRKRKRSRVPRLPLRPPDDYLREAMAKTLAEQDVEFDITLQLQTDPHRMPIENNAVYWPPRLSPRVPAAVLHIPKQTFDSPEQLDFARVLTYNPWHSVPEHRPLGNQSRARKRMYYELSRLRQAKNDVEHYEPTGDEEFPGSPAAGQGAQRRQPRHEEVGAAFHGDEARHARVALSDSLAGSGEAAPERLGRADQRVGVVVEPGELRVVQPGLLHELELAGDVPAQADEVEAARLAVVLGVECFLGRERRAVLTAAAQEPMPPVQLQGVVRAGIRVERVARIRPPDVGADGAESAARVVAW